VVDITGGMFGVIGILAALERRHRTGRGGDVKCALFETTAFLVGQHMAQEAVTGKAPRPMPDRISAWAIYDVLETRLPDEQVFVGVVSDGQWVAFCEAFGLDAFLADATLATNNQRVEARERILPTVRDCFRAMSRAEAVALLERLGLPFAPIATPSDLFDDQHLGAGGGLVDLTLEDGTNTRLPGLPIEVDGSRMPRRLGLPTPGEHGAELLREAGLSEDRIAAALA
jgi:crotonobetainyl-CoA:carnitine CoA-transferase CaiB-like acyl-CoA transferase